MLKQVAVTTFFFILGIVIGLKIPDADLTLSGMLVHRSILTHGLLVSGLFMIFAFWSQDERLYTLAVGVCVATAVHLSFDLYPIGWRGFALLHIPFYGRTTPLFSWVWILSSIASSIYWAFLYVSKKAFELILTFSGLIMTFVVVALKEAFFIAAFITLIGIVCTVFFLPVNPLIIVKKILKNRRTS